MIFMQTERMKDLMLWAQNLKKNSRHRLADYVKNCTKKRPAREARLFVLIQPIISLIRGVVISGAVAIS